MATKSPGSVLNVEEIKIGPVVWQLIPETRTDRDYAGHCTSIRQHQIAVKATDSQDPESDHIDTVLHEILHAISLVYFVQTKLSERQVELIAEAMEALLLDNPKFSKWLYEYSMWQRSARKRRK